MSTPQQHIPPQVTRELFDAAYGEIFGVSTERVEVEVLEPLPNDVVRLFFELADEALLNPARDNPFATEKRVFELSSESLASELVRLQRLGEAALLAFNRPASGHSAGQLPAMLATMYVGATRIKPAPTNSRIMAALLDNALILLIASIVALFTTWFSAPELRPAILTFDGPALISLLALTAAVYLPIGVAYHLKPGRSPGYRAQHLEVVNFKSGNPIGMTVSRMRAWLMPLGIISLLAGGMSGRWLVDRATNTTVRRNYALKTKLK